ncbi:hypothetical protein DFH28DRAFT_1020348 [Melampsora americana]|nr:hypothetical protein DFH28DRAFT_1020348 [Melampsora americana]
MFVGQLRACRVIPIILFTAFISKTISPASIPTIGKFEHIEEITNKAHKGEIISDTVKNGSADIGPILNPNLADSDPVAKFRWQDQSSPNMESIPKIAEENGKGFDGHLDRAIRNRRPKMKQTPRSYYKTRSGSPRLKFKTYFLDPWKSFFTKIILSLKPFVIIKIQDICCRNRLSDHASKCDPDLTSSGYAMIDKIRY